jgi:hypothetical protein
MSFDDVPNECVIHILSFLRAVDLNSFAMCGRLCRQARMSDSLDQRRFGTIMCSDQSSVLRVLKALSIGDWNNELYSGNRTDLMIEQLENLTTVRNPEEVADNEEMVELQLMSVSFLAMCTTDGTTDWTNAIDYPKTIPHQGPIDVIQSLSIVLPNVTAVEFNGDFNEYPSHLVWSFGHCFAALDRFSWHYSGWGVEEYWKHDYLLTLDGNNFSIQGEEKIKELYLDHSRFVFPRGKSWYDFESNGGDFLFGECKGLVKLSILGAVHILEDTDEYGWPEYIDEPISQKMIIKMVRNMPLLRWLCSDLTDENVATLRQERPNLTFRNKNKLDV